MKAFFATYGKVVDATVMVDRESGRSKGFGFVTFEDAQDTDQLVGRSDLILDEKQVGNFPLRDFPSLISLVRSRSKPLNPGASVTKPATRMAVSHSSTTGNREHRQ